MVHYPNMASNTTQPVDYLSLFNNYLNPINAQVDDYANGLIDQANGDYGFAAKWIEDEYKKALGTDDQERAQFLKNVADSLEGKVGRIEYDYNTGTYRANRDANKTITRTQADKSLALQRLDEDQKVQTDQLKREVAQGRQDLGGNLNSRGLLTTDLNSATGLAGKEVNNFDVNANDRFSALQRAFQRQSFDTTQTADRTVQDTQDQLGDTLQNLKTTARRGAEDATATRDQSIEQAARLRDRQKQQAEAERRSGKNQAKTIADYYTRGQVGL